MTTYIIRLSDSGKVDRLATVTVHSRDEIGRAAQLALDDALSTAAEEIRFPILIEIHPETQFHHVAWMHRN